MADWSASNHLKLSVVFSMAIRKIIPRSISLLCWCILDPSFTVLSGPNGFFLQELMIF